MNSTPIVAAVLAPFILWRVYNRIKRLLVRQRSQMWRHWTAAVLFPLLMVALALAAIGMPLTLAALAGGVAAGVALGVVGLQRTRFEQVGDEFFYTPSAHIGLLVSMLFIGRMLYRGYEFYALGLAQQEFGRSPLTLLVFGVLAGYYATYATGLIRWRRTAGSAAID